MAAEPEHHWTVEEYLELERDTQHKHQLIDGEVVMMVGASPNHNLITGNTYAALHAQLRNRPCVVYPSDQRVKFGQSDYTYPDVTVVCGTTQFEEGYTLLNPTLIVEVLSPSTERYDRGKKFQYYRLLESLQEYVLISQDSLRIELFRRAEDGQWTLIDASTMESMVELQSIGCSLLLSDVYEKISFEDEAG